MSAIKTKLDGLEFRSRTEAAWYQVFKDFGLNPVYEPQTFELDINCGDEIIWYMPDFSIDWHGPMMVEVKAGLDGELQDIAKACVLGYEIATLIIVGWPLHYRAVVIHERVKGNPEGYELVFRSDLNGYPCVTPRNEIWLACSYPDEGDLTIHELDVHHFNPKHKPAIGTVEGNIARNAWNKTKWNR